MDDKHSEAMTPIGGQTIVDIEIEFASKMIYYADTSGSNRGINKIGRDGSGMKQIVHDKIGQYGIQSIAVDWINCKLAFFQILVPTKYSLEHFMQYV